MLSENDCNHFTAYGIGVGLAFIAIVYSAINSIELKKQTKSLKKDIDSRIRPIITLGIFDEDNTILRISSDHLVDIRIVNTGVLPALRIRQYFSGRIDDNSPLLIDEMKSGESLIDKAFQRDRSYPTTYSGVTSLGPTEYTMYRHQIQPLDYEMSKHKKYRFQFYIEYASLNDDKKYHYYMEGFFREDVSVVERRQMN
ncbi:hypothetical protein CENSYa_1093 [Cenarchaeum symbiosum A]|uniref:Uncharacterized protein n=1 Tax=Cenarchaeum symbiosum (strain A) TaxID=414004 RepID=A0RWK5_CENSY|nr:hypothetical protein CENSYa_1093 [Cenarchaeum symbiosum A]